MTRSSAMMGPGRQGRKLAAVAPLAVAVCLALATAPAWVAGGKAAPRPPARIAARGVSTFGATNVIPKSALEQLRGLSLVVPDLFASDQSDHLAMGDVAEATPKFTLASSRTIVEALESESGPSLADLVSQAMSNERCAVEWDMPDTDQCFFESLVVLVGKHLLGRLSDFARVSTELPPGALASPAAAARSGGRILQMYSDLGVAADRVLLRVPASYEGLRAARALSEAGLQAHVTNVYSVQQAALAREAGAAAVQVYVGRVDEAGGDGVALAREINAVLKGESGEGPALVAASLRSIAHVSALAGAEYMLVSPAVLEELREMPSLDDLGPEGGLPGAAPAGAPRDVDGGFLLPPADFDASLSSLARGLLEAGVAKNLKEHAALQALVESAKEYL